MAMNNLERPMRWQSRIRTAFLVVLKHTLNPVTRRLAGTSFGPFASVQHVGRRSGKPYATPIIVSPAADGLVIELTYGPAVDWHQNLLAAGGFHLVLASPPGPHRPVEAP